MGDREAIYRSSNLFQAGTVHHAAEIGSVKAVQQVEQKQKQLRGLPADVVLAQRDELLQVCAPILVHLTHELPRCQASVGVADPIPCTCSVWLYMLLLSMGT
jgi:hypothetical protein